MLELKTMLILATLTMLLLSLIYGLLLWRFPHERSVRLMFYYSLFLLLAQPLFALRNVIPDLLSIIAANMLLSAGIVTLYQGIRNLCGLESSWRARYALPLGIVAAGLIIFTYGYYDTAMRIVILSLFLALFTLQMTIILWRCSSSKLRSINRITAFIFFLSGCAYTLRAIIAMSEKVPAFYLKVSDPLLVLPYVFIVPINLWIGLLFGLHLYVQKRNPL